MASILRSSNRKPALPRNKRSVDMELDYAKAFFIVHRLVTDYKKSKTKRSSPAINYILVSNKVYWILYERYLKDGYNGELIVDGYRVIGSFQLHDSQSYLCYC